MNWWLPKERGMEGMDEIDAGDEEDTYWDEHNV